METRSSFSDEKLRERFLALQQPHEIAELLEVSYPFLEYWLYTASSESKYITFALPKSTGGFRKISAPTKNLKILQKKLNVVLQAIYKVKKPVYGFVFNKNVRMNADVHAGQHYVLNLDLQDFFPSINFGRVRGLFISYPYDLPENIATILAQICCHENALPQGAPTSPVVANMICGQLDDELLALAVRNGCRYTRYADDITFSTSRLIFPPNIARSEYETQSGKVIWYLAPELKGGIKKNGFVVNSEKVRMQTINQHQEVTGLTTNKFPNVKRQYVRQIRAMLHAWEKYGLAAAHREYYNQYNERRRGPYKSQPPFKQIVKGKIEFLGMVRGRDDPIYLRFQEKYEGLVSQHPPLISVVPASISPKTSQRFDLSGWIETIPFPLASILRAYDATDDEKEKYERLLHFFEAFAAFWATILLTFGASVRD